MSKKQTKFGGNLLNAVLYILVGVLLCIFRGSVLNWAMTAIGAVLVVMGVLKAVGGELVEGIVTAAIGAVIILGGWLFVDIILLILGVVLVIRGVLDLLKSLGKGIPALVAAIITIVVGVMLVVGKWVSFLDILLLIIGIVLIVDGILMLLGKKK